jgi:2-polyprenyl-3-methyl-5-hydroxy-6-metoxy-1,4-benzoquinol methylase
MKVENKIDEVKNFWSMGVCGSQFIRHYKDEDDFYRQYRAFRYRNEPHIKEFVPFAEMCCKEVLEIGCGLGVDGSLFAAGGAQYTGVDLTELAVRVSKRYFEMLDLPGVFQVENAEELGFRDSSFDVVYCYGVLHHTPNPAKIVHEIHRVLRPGGEAYLMLYNKHSINYLRVLSYIRFIALVRVIAACRRWASDRQAALLRAREGLRRRHHESVWATHYENFLLEGWSYFNSENFAHHWPDGPLCPIAYTYSKSDARALLSCFESVDMRVSYLPLRRHLWARWLPPALEELLASRVGWHLLIRATKAAQPSNGMHVGYHSSTVQGEPP